MTATPDPIDLDAVDALCDAATPGEWTWLYPNQCCDGHCLAVNDGSDVLHDAQELRLADAALIAAARTLLRALAAEVRALRHDRDHPLGGIRHETSCVEDA